MRALALTLVLIAAAGSAKSEILRRGTGGLPAPPKNLPPAEAEIWPFPPPDPKAWWDDKRPLPPEAANPLGGRRQGRGERLIPIDNGIDPSTYRLWGLMPLQWQLLRGQEMILEVWVRPARTVRQSVIRVTVRRDGRAFAEARVGLACCEADIARRVGFDVELPAGQAAKFLALRSAPIWAAPRDVRVREGGDIAEDVCVSGTSYDMTLVVPGRSRSIRRACDAAAVGQAADVLEAAFSAALGHEPRFDVIYPGGASFAAEWSAYQELIAGGGSLRPDPRTRSQPPEVAPAPDEPTPPAPGPPPATPPARPGSVGGR